MYKRGVTICTYACRRIVTIVYPENGKIKNKKIYASTFSFVGFGGGFAQCISRQLEMPCVRVHTRPGKGTMSR